MKGGINGEMKKNTSSCKDCGCKAIYKSGYCRMCYMMHLNFRFKCDDFEHEPESMPNWFMD